jgi:hypothetical protein
VPPKTGDVGLVCQIDDVYHDNKAGVVVQPRPQLCLCVCVQLYSVVSFQLLHSV